jgi:hypothetical protein
MYTIISTLLILVSSASAEPVNLKRQPLLSVTPLDSKAVVAVASGRGEAGFAVCELQGSIPANCELVTPWFPIEQMRAVQVRFETRLREREWNPSQEGFEIGALLSMGLKPTDVGTYYGIKSLSKLSESVISHYARIFNSDVNSPVFVDFDAAGGSMTHGRLLSTLQFAASLLSR